MSAVVDETHDPALRCWVTTADEGDFPIQNLPFGMFSPSGEKPRAGVAIGDQILDLAGLRADGVLGDCGDDLARALDRASLNDLLSLGTGPRRWLRRRLSALLRLDAPEQERIAPLLHQMGECTLHLPCAIGDYTDFYAGIHHARNVGALFRPDEPLLANYKHMPIGYHGRASSVRASGIPVRRPLGQTRPPTASAPSFGASQRLDYELELGIWIGAGNTSGTPVPIGDAHEHIAGFCLLNDWSARDIQAWEYQPLGPFLAKNFATTISCWVVTPEAMAPFRGPASSRPDGDPEPLPYLMDRNDQQSGGLELGLEVWLQTAMQRQLGLPASRLAVSNAAHLYWTAGQMVAHHASGGCDFRPGDLLGSGTISGPDPGSVGSLLEATNGGKRPIELEGGEQRHFLHDGDELSLRARASRPGFVSIGFGECRAVVLPAPTW